MLAEAQALVLRQFFNILNKPQGWHFWNKFKIS